MDFPLFVNSEYKCTGNCPTGQVFDSSTQSCLTTNGNFANCNMVAANTCIQCSTGFLLTSDGSCENVCADGWFSDSMQCVQCPSGCGYCDLSGNCLYWSEEPATVSCGDGCLKCLNSMCVLCSQLSGALYLDLNTGTCSAGCPAGTFADSISKQCRPCKPGCNSCTAFQVCDSCPAGTFLQN